MSCPQRESGPCEARTDPRYEGSCAFCGHVLPTRPSLEHHVSDTFQHLAEALEGAGHKPRDLPCADFDAFKAITLARVRNGQREHGERWRELDLAQEAIEEVADLKVYCAGLLATRGPDADLFDALFHAYLAFAAIRRHQARGEDA